MMFAVGCIQAQRCHTNTCPTGVATQDTAVPAPSTSNKRGEDVCRYHRLTIRVSWISPGRWVPRIPRTCIRAWCCAASPTTTTRSYAEIFPVW